MTSETSASKQRPRIAYLTTSYPSVSHTFIRREIHGLERLGYSILRLAIRPGSAVVDPDDQAEEAKTHHCLGQPKWKLILTALFTFIRRTPRMPRVLRAIWQMSLASDRSLFRHLAYLIEAGALYPLLKSNSIDHVHVHFGTNAAAVARLIRLLGGPTYSMTVHGPDELDGPIGFSLGQKMQDAAFTVAITHYCSSQLRRWIPYSEWSKIHIVHCTVGDDWFDKATPISEESDTIVCVGRLSGQKGQLLLVDAFADAMHKGADGKLVLVGDGEMRDVVEDRIRAHNLQNRITITGWQEGAAVRQQLLDGRALVLPSFAEGLPVVIMEAMALRRPVLSTTIMGIPELVHHGEHGWMVIAGDQDSLSDAIVSLYETPVERLNEMGAACQARVRERHSTAREVEKLDTLFKQYTTGD